MLRSISWVAVALVSCVTVARAEKVANPQYENWSKFKPGAFSKVDSDTTTAGTNAKSTTTTKLLELTPEKAVIEIVIVTTVMGQTMDMPPQKLEFPAQVEKPAETAEAPRKNTGEETLKVNGKDLKTTWTEVTTAQGGTNITSKTWLSPEVPGGLVKVTSSSTGAMASNITMTLVEYADGK